MEIFCAKITKEYQNVEMDENTRRIADNFLISY